MLINGNFANSTITGWTLSGNGPTAIFPTAGVVRLSGNPSFLSQPITTVIGVVYRVTGNIVAVEDAAAFHGIRKADDAGASSNVINILAGTIGPGAANATFTATATTSYIVLQSNGATWTEFDNLVANPA